MKFRRCFVLAAPLVAGVVGCSGPDDPKIIEAPPPPPVTPAQASANQPPVKYMNNPRYIQGMEKMQRAASGRR